MRKICLVISILIQGQFGVGFMEMVKTIILQQDPPNHKIDGDPSLKAPSSTSKNGIFIA